MTVNVSDFSRFPGIVAVGPNTVVRETTNHDTQEAATVAAEMGAYFHSGRVQFVEILARPTRAPDEGDRPAIESAVIDWLMEKGWMCRRVQGL